MSRFPSPSLVRRLSTAALLLLTACGGKEVAQLRYDSDGVAQDVLALIAHNTRWARSVQPDAVLYRIELRADGSTDTAPTEALYSFYSAGSKTFMTATSDPKIPWAGAEPQPWPAGRPAPAPLPRVSLDFADAWKQAREGKVTNVTSAVLEVNTLNAMPVVAWSILGRMPVLSQRGVFLDALTGQRINGNQLTEIPSSELYVQNAVEAYRGALREEQAESAKGCTGGAVRVPAQESVVCYDPVLRSYTPLAAK